MLLRAIGILVVLGAMAGIVLLTVGQGDAGKPRKGTPAHGAAAPTAPAADDPVVASSARPQRTLPRLPEADTPYNPAERGPTESVQRYRTRQYVRDNYRTWESMYMVPGPDSERARKALADARHNHAVRVDDMRTAGIVGAPEYSFDEHKAAIESRDIKTALVAELSTFLTDHQVEGLDNEIGWDLLLQFDPR